MNGKSTDYNFLRDINFDGKQYRPTISDSTAVKVHIPVSEKIKAAFAKFRINLIGKKIDRLDTKISNYDKELNLKDELNTKLSSVNRSEGTKPDWSTIKSNADDAMEIKADQRYFMDKKIVLLKKIRMIAAKGLNINPDIDSFVSVDEETFKNLSNTKPNIIPTVTKPEEARKIMDNIFNPIEKVQNQAPFKRPGDNGVIYGSAPKPIVPTSIYKNGDRFEFDGNTNSNDTGLLTNTSRIASKPVELSGVENDNPITKHIEGISNEITAKKPIVDSTVTPGIGSLDIEGIIAAEIAKNKRFAQFEADNRRLIAEAEASKISQDKKDEEIAMLKKDNEHFKGELSEKDIKIADIQTQVKSLNADKGKKDVENDILKKANETITAELSEVNKSVLHYQDLTKNYAELKADLEKINVRVAEQDKKNKELEDNLREATSQKDAALGQLSRLVTSIGPLDSFTQTK